MGGLATRYDLLSTSLGSVLAQQTRWNDATSGAAGALSRAEASTSSFTTALNAQATALERVIALQDRLGGMPAGGGGAGVGAPAAYDAQATYSQISGYHNSAEVAMARANVASGKADLLLNQMAGWENPTPPPVPPAAREAGGLMSGLGESALLSQMGYMLPSMAAYGAFSLLKGGLNSAQQLGLLTQTTAAQTANDPNSAAYQGFIAQMRATAESGTSPYNEMQLIQGAYAPLSYNLNPTLAASLTGLSTKASFAGGAPDNSADSQALMTMLSAYGMLNGSNAQVMGHASSIQDSILAAVQYGSLEFPQIAPVVHTFADTSAQMGISPQEALGNLTLQSRSGIDAAQGAQNLYALESAFANPSRTQQGMWRDLFGPNAKLTSSVFKDNGGLMGVSTMLEQSLSSLNPQQQLSVLDKLMGREDAAKGFLAFAGAGGINTQPGTAGYHAYQNVVNAKGTTQTAYDFSQQGMSAKIADDEAALQTKWANLAKAMQPLEDQMLTGLGRLVDGLNVTGASLDSWSRYLNLPAKATTAKNWVDQHVPGGAGTVLAPLAGPIGLMGVATSAAFGLGSAAYHHFEPSHAATMTAHTTALHMHAAAIHAVAQSPGLTAFNQLTRGLIPFTSSPTLLGGVGATAANAQANAALANQEQSAHYAAGARLALQDATSGALRLPTPQQNDLKLIQSLETQNATTQKLTLALNHYHHDVFNGAGAVGNQAQKEAVYGLEAHKVGAFEDKRNLVSDQDMAKTANLMYQAAILNRETPAQIKAAFDTYISDERATLILQAKNGSLSGAALAYANAQINNQVFGFNDSLGKQAGAAGQLKFTDATVQAAQLQYQAAQLLHESPAQITAAFNGYIDQQRALILETTGKGSVAQKNALADLHNQQLTYGNSARDQGLQTTLKNLQEHLQYDQLRGVNSQGDEAKLLAFERANKTALSMDNLSIAIQQLQYTDAQKATGPVLIRPTNLGSGSLEAGFGQTRATLYGGGPSAQDEMVSSLKALLAQAQERAAKAEERDRALAAQLTVAQAQLAAQREIAANTHHTVSPARGDPHSGTRGRR